MEIFLKHFREEDFEDFSRSYKANPHKVFPKQIDVLHQKLNLALNGAFLSEDFDFMIIPDRQSCISAVTFLKKNKIKVLPEIAFPEVDDEKATKKLKGSVFFIWNSYPNVYQIEFNGKKILYHEYSFNSSKNDGDNDEDVVYSAPKTKKIDMECPEDIIKKINSCTLQLKSLTFEVGGEQAFFPVC